MSQPSSPQSACHPSPPAPLAVDPFALLAAGSAPRAPRASGCSLHDCLRCSSPLLQPVRWTEVAKGRGRLVRRCPECDLVCEDVVRDEELDQYEEELDQATAELAADLAVLARARMTDEVERFLLALRAGAIEPFDF